MEKEKTLIFTDGKGNFGCKVQLSERIWFDEKDGFLYCNDVVLGNIGVQYYKGYELGFKDANADIEVHREAEDVFDEVSLDSLKGKPVTLRHPNKMLNSDTATDHIRGTIYGEPRRDGDNIVCNLVIYDRELIDLVAPEDENGERKLSTEFRDLSLGYRAKLVKLDKPNTYKQTNILYNHVAVLEAGRQANAEIRDGANPEIAKGVKGLMGIFTRIKGKKVVTNQETKDVIISDEMGEVEVSIEDAQKIVREYESHNVSKNPSWEDPNKTIITETTVKEVTTEVDNEVEEKPKNEKEIKDTMEVIKDKAYFMKELKDAQALPDGAIKEALIESLNKEFSDAFPKAVVVNDGATPKINPINNDKEIQKVFKDGQTPKTDYQAFEAESRKYYLNLTDPFQHESWEAFKKNYEKEQRLGRMVI